MDLSATIAIVFSGVKNRPRDTFCKWKLGAVASPTVSFTGETTALAAGEMRTIQSVEVNFNLVRSVNHPRFGHASEAM